MPGNIHKGEPADFDWLGLRLKSTSSGKQMGLDAESRMNIKAASTANIIEKQKGLRDIHASLF